MKAAKVRGLKREAPLADSLQRIVETRLRELWAFMPGVQDPRRVSELHDMRIAAKRLRYCLEISTGLFGPYAAVALGRAKELQKVLGEIHDCDMTLPRVTALSAQAQAADVAAVLAAAGQAADLDPALLASSAPNVAAQRGLATTALYLRARRELLFARFLDLWLQLEREGFRARLEFAAGERPVPAAPSHDLHVDAVPADLLSVTA